MNEFEDRNILRFGGLAGILGGILFLASLVVVLVGPVGFEDPGDLEGWVTQFPDVRVARMVENSLYLGGLVLGVALVLAVVWALRKRRLAYALFGGTLSILGLAVFMVGAFPHVATGPISDLYHATEASSADRASLVLMWQATQGMLDSALAVGFVLVPLGFIAFGVAMFATPAFGSGWGWLTVVLGVVGLAAAFVNVAATSAIVAGSFLAMIVFYVAVGWRVFALSRLQQRRREGGAAVPMRGT